MTAPRRNTINRRSQITLPSGIVLPYSARPDLADQKTVLMGSAGGAQGFASVTVGGELQIPVSIFVPGLTSAVVANRLAHLHIAHGFYSNYVFVPAAAVIPENTSYTLSWISTISAAFSARAQQTSSTVFSQEMAMPLPVVVLNPGDTVTVNILWGDVADTVQNSYYTYISIPTGPPLDYELPHETLRATPII